MPTRILRDGILSSDRINALSYAEEVFYRRLMSVTDDYGRYAAHNSLIRAACYPLRLDKVSDSDVGKWLLATEKAGLVRVYPAQDGKRYLEILDFGQRIQSKSKYPPPVDDGGKRESTVDHGESPGKTALVGDVVGDEGEGGKRTRDPSGSRLPADFDPGEEGRQYAKAKGLNPETVLEAFRDYWTSAPGAKGRKADWPATWRTWCRKDAEQRGGKQVAGEARVRVDL